MSVVVITGGSRGIGACTAEYCAERGMGVILTYKSDGQAADSVVERIQAAGGKAVALELDLALVSDFAGFREAVQRSLQATWGVTVLGGLESKGHPIGATGLGQIHELVTQLRGEAGVRQVEGAKVALQGNGGGLIGYEEAVVTVNLFTR